jgi:replication factor C large subunit
MSFTDKYKPKNLREFVNQKEAKDAVLKWLERWKPRAKPLLLFGPPGSGKTCLIEALAREKNYDLVQMNASDVRSAAQIKEVIGKSMIQQSLFKKGKIFLLDEIEGLYGKEDFGGVKEIIIMIKETCHPLVLISNNPYDPKLRALRQYCLLVRFSKIPVFDIEKRLKQICENEKIKCDEEVLRQIAKRSEGDLRAAINDLEVVVAGKKEISPEDLEVLGYREREKNIFDFLKIIFKTKTALAAKLAIGEVDKDPEEIFWWIENNIAEEYEKPEEIAKAFEILSKADLFRRRVTLRQDWSFRAYMIDLMTAGVATVKKEMYHKFTRYQYPRNVMLLGATKFSRKSMAEISLKLSRELHVSQKKLKSEYLPFLRIILKDKKRLGEFASALGIELEDFKSLLK